MRILLIYHFFHPDDVISSRLFSDLAEDLAKAGHKVTVYCSNRHKWQKWELPPQENWKNVDIRRFFRPDLSQTGNFRRIFSSFVLQLKWLRAFWKNRHSYDAVVLGTDPQFGYMMFPFLRWMNPEVKLVHWCFDLFPDAILAGSALWMRALAALTLPFVHFALRYVDLMADLGPAMRRRLQKYNAQCRCRTLLPWALYEPETVHAADPACRKELFGNAKLAILYSGTVGAVHDIAPFVALARACRAKGVDAAFCFAGNGSRFERQTACVTAEDTNIRITGFADEKKLSKRLEAADIHMVSLRSPWDGIVFPSKFFGALAAGRPLLFAGDADSDLGAWIRQFQIGWNFQTADLDAMVETLRDLIDHPEKLETFQRAAQDCYRRRFSRRTEVAQWLEEFAEK